MPDLDSLSQLETLLLRSGFAATAAIAAWSAWHCLPGRAKAAASGEAVWTAVAVLMLAVVVAAVGGAGVRAV